MLPSDANGKSIWHIWNLCGFLNYHSLSVWHFITVHFIDWCAEDIHSLSLLDNFILLAIIHSHEQGNVLRRKEWRIKKQREKDKAGIDVHVKIEKKRIGGRIEKCWPGMTLEGHKLTWASCLGNEATGKVMCTFSVKSPRLDGPRGSPLSFRLAGVGYCVTGNGWLRKSSGNEETKRKCRGQNGTGIQQSDRHIEIVGMKNTALATKHSYKSRTCGIQATRSESHVGG